MKKHAFVLASALICIAGAASAQTNLTSDGGFFSDWFERVTKTQNEQPHWMTPIATVTPRLEEEYRYDQDWETASGGKTVTSYGGGKGLELIPAERVEVILGVPAWVQRNMGDRNGFGDESFLLKYRILSANEDEGNYIVTGFLGLSVPSGSIGETSQRYATTPTLALGKGFGNFDVQSTIGWSIPDNSDSKGPGSPLAVNTTLQYKVGTCIWPEVEFNYTYWPNGKDEGLNQLYITPGIILGRFPIWDRLALSIGVGYQIALTDKPDYNHNFILSARLPF